MHFNKVDKHVGFHDLFILWMTTDLESVETLLAPLLVDGNGGEAVAGLVLHHQRGLPSQRPPLNTNHKNKPLHSGNPDVF